MNLIRKAGAALLALCTAVSCAACGERTANAIKVGDYDVRAGIYLYYATSAFGEAVETMRKDGANFDECKTSADYKKLMKNANIDGVTAEQWIQDKAAEHCATFVAIEKEFDSLGLTLTGEQLATADSSAASSMNNFGEYFEKTGIGEQSIKDIILNSYKQDALWDAYYGEEGSKAPDPQELYDYYVKNTIRAKYIEMPLKDGEGNLLKADGKKEIEEMANDYLKRLGKKKNDEKALMEEFDFLIEEHQNYVTSLSEAAVTTTDENGNTITTPTTAKVTTDKDGNTGTTEAVTTAPAEDDDETAEGGEPAEGATTATTTTTTTETTTTGEGVDYAVDKEVTLKVSTTAEDAEKEDETTTEPTYTPCEKVYNWLVDPETDYLKPELIKDDECYYIVVKLDIRDRMVDSDLWGSSRIENVRTTLYYDIFLEDLENIADGYQSVRNEAAFRRYKVLDLDYVEYQNAVMQSYYSMYGGSN